MKYILILICVLPIVLFGQRSIKTIRGEDLKGVSNYQIITGHPDSLPKNEKLGMLFSERCEGWIEYCYIVDNTKEGVKLILDETLTLLNKNGQDISKPRYDFSRYMYLIKDTLTGEYDYGKISKYCGFVHKMYNGQHVSLEWRTHKGPVEWAIQLVIRNYTATLLMVRRDKYEEHCY